MTADASKACVLGHFEEIWNKGRLDLVDEYFSESFMNFGTEYRDARPVVRYIVTVWRTAFPDLRFTADAVIAEGDTVMCEMTLEGTHAGEFLLIPPLEGPALQPNGKSFRVKHFHRFRLKDGKIVDHFAVRDDLGMFQQLGHLTALSRS
jgi:predicted ester cyclase